MRTLLIESADPDVTASSPVAEALDAAGHDIVRCHPADGPAFPCAGLTGEGCPIESHGPIDVAITVRPDTATVPTADESGATCAIRVGLPMVVLGGAQQPFAPWAETASSVDDLLGAVDRAVASLAARRAAPLVTEVERVLSVEGIDAGRVAVEVERTGDSAHILIRTEREVPERVENVLATRVHAVDQTGSWPTTKVGVAVGRL